MKPETKTYEIYNVDTKQVEDVEEVTPAYAEQANKDFRYVDSPRRYILQRPLPSPNCSCKVET